MTRNMTMNKIIKISLLVNLVLITILFIVYISHKFYFRDDQNKNLEDTYIINEASTQQVLTVKKENLTCFNFCINQSYDTCEKLFNDSYNRSKKNTCFKNNYTSCTKQECE